MAIQEALMPEVLERKQPEGNGAAQLQVVPNPYVLMQLAIERNLDTDKLEKIMQLERQWKADIAREAFHKAKAALATENIIITKDKTNSQYNSPYTSIGNLVNTATPFLGKHKLSANWEILQDESRITVTCTLTHELGYSKSAFVKLPADKSGSKNPLQEIKSAITYGKICTFESVCGLASTEGNLDDDGNAGGCRMEGIDEWMDKFKECDTFESLDKEFRKAYSIASELKDQKAQQALAGAKDKRRGELRMRMK